MSACSLCGVIRASGSLADQSKLANILNMFFSSKPSAAASSCLICLTSTGLSFFTTTVRMPAVFVKLFPGEEQKVEFFYGETSFPNKTRCFFPLQNSGQSYTPVNGWRDTLHPDSSPDPCDPPLPPVWDWALQYSQQRRDAFTQPVPPLPPAQPLLNGNLNTNPDSHRVSARKPTAPPVSELPLVAE